MGRGGVQADRACLPALRSGALRDGVGEQVMWAMMNGVVHLTDKA
eukprot:contig_22306_g5512